MCLVASNNFRGERKTNTIFFRKPSNSEKFVTLEITGVSLGLLFFLFFLAFRMSVCCVCVSVISICLSV